MQKINQLQDLRGIAILMVVLFHAGTHFHYFSEGKTGVSLFFMVSGFIISSIHASHRGQTDFIVFMKKRIVRIYFPYWPIVLAFILLFAVTGKGSDYHHAVSSIIRNIFLVQDPEKSIHPYAWTLVFELFYYVYFGLFAILLRGGVMLFVFALATPPILNLAFGIGEQANPQIFWSIYNLYFVAGVLLGLCFKKLKDKSNIYLASISFAIFLVTPFLTESKLALLVVTILFFTLYLAQSHSFGVLNKIGNASYSIYLVHALVLSIGKYVVPGGWSGFFILFPLCIAAGYFYYLKVETPLLAMGTDLLGLKKRRDKALAIP